MGWLSELGRRLLMLVGRKQFDRDLAEEMRLHLEMREQDHIQSGLSSDEAQHAARRQFGNEMLLKEVASDMWGWNWLENFLQDVRYGLRMLAKNPGFTTVSVLTLALGIGANTAVFSVVNAVLLRPVPYQNPDRLVMLWQTHLAKGDEIGPVAPANFVDWREQSRVFEQVAAIDPFASFNLTGVENPERLQGVRVSQGFFSILGAKAAVGHFFLPENYEAGRDRVAVLSFGLWQRRFGSDPQVMGRSLTLNGESYVVIGILPSDFQFVARPSDFQLINTQVDVWVPLIVGPDPQRGTHPYRVIAALRRGATLPEAQAEMSTIARRLSQEYPEYNKDTGIKVVPLYEQVVGDVRPALLVLLGAVGFVFLIACGNVANLLLARAAGRGREMSIRGALGASRGRLVRQMLTESILLALAGGFVGLFVAVGGLHFLIQLGPRDVPRIRQAGLDGPVLSFTVLSALLTTIIFGVLPGVQMSGGESMAGLKEGNRSRTKRVSHARDFLVVAEVTLALVLSIGAGLLVKSFWRLQHVDPGFRTENVLAVDLSLPDSTYPLQYRPASAKGGSGVWIGVPRVTAFYSQLLNRTRNSPGVISAGVMNYLPLSGTTNAWSFRIEGRPPVPPGQYNMADWRVISPEYFRTMGIPVQEGRDFDDHDSDGAPKVAIVNQTMVRRYWPNEDPVGKRISIGGEEWRQIVGVVADVRHYALDTQDAAEIYVSFPQSNSPWRHMTLVMRTSADPAAAAGMVRDEVHGLDKDLPLFNIRTMKQLVAHSLSRPRFNMVLMMIFGSMATLLAMVGVYGVISYLVDQRTREIGIRMALGAERGDVLRLVVRQGLLLALVGVGVGLVMAVALTRLLSGLLYEVRPADPLTYGVVSLGLVAVAVFASYIPARRATKVDPMVALRHE